MEEIWKDVKGYEGLYQVSNLGRVKSLERVVIRGNGHGKHIIKEKVKKPFKATYLQLFLSKGVKKLHFIHRLVAEAFIPNPQNLPCIDHINTDKYDNRVENLRWCTMKENQNNPLTRKHMSESKKGEKSHMWGKRGKLNWSSKPTLQYTLSGKLIREWDAVMDIERELGYHQGCISKCCRGESETSYGFKWKYKE